eukprot:Pgem_evm1s1608
MNYLTAIMAVIVFTLVLFFDIYIIITKRERLNKKSRSIQIKFWVLSSVSLIQTISCYFWLCGFALGNLNGFFSEGFEAAWTTAVNRRCPTATKILPGFTHHFYPIYLIFDIIVYAIAFKSVSKVSEYSKSNITRNFYIVFLTAIPAIGMFVLQFMIKITALSVVACVFCLLMYLGYFLRQKAIIYLFTSPWFSLFSKENELKDSKYSSSSSNSKQLASSNMFSVAGRASRVDNGTSTKFTKNETVVKCQELHKLVVSELDNSELVLVDKNNTHIDTVYEG